MLCSVYQTTILIPPSSVAQHTEEVPMLEQEASFTLLAEFQGQIILMGCRTPEKRGEEPTTSMDNQQMEVHQQDLLLVMTEETG